MIAVGDSNELDFIPFWNQDRGAIKDKTISTGRNNGTIAIDRKCQRYEFFCLKFPVKKEFHLATVKSIDSYVVGLTFLDSKSNTRETIFKIIIFRQDFIGTCLAQILTNISSDEGVRLPPVSRL